MDRIDENSSEGLSSTVFEEFESANKIKLAPHLKSMLVANGFDNEILLKNITDTDVNAIEHYTQTELYRCLPESEYKIFYGPVYRWQPYKFVLVRGHKKLIFLMQEFFQNKHKSLAKNTANKRTMMEGTTGVASNNGMYLKLSKEKPGKPINKIVEFASPDNISDVSDISDLENSD